MNPVLPMGLGASGSPPYELLIKAPCRRSGRFTDPCRSRAISPRRHGRSAAGIAGFGSATPQVPLELGRDRLAGRRLERLVLLVALLERLDVFGDLLVL